MKTFHLYVLLSIVALVLMVLTTVGSFALRGEAAWSDLLLNLSAEIFGILATVFVIERIIASREGQEWIPAKHVTYERLLAIIDGLIDEIFLAQGQISPDPTFKEHSMTLSPREKRRFEIYVKGLSSQQQRHLQANLQPVRNVKSDPKAYTKEDLVAYAVDIGMDAYRKDVEFKRYDLRLLIVLPYKETEKAYTKCSTALRGVLDTSASLLEAELTNMVHALDYEIGRATNAIRYVWRDPNPDRYNTDAIKLDIRRTLAKLETNIREREVVTTDGFEQHLREVEEQIREVADELCVPLYENTAAVLRVASESKNWLENKLRVHH